MLHVIKPASSSCSRSTSSYIVHVPRYLSTSSFGPVIVIRTPILVDLRADSHRPRYKSSHLATWRRKMKDKADNMLWGSPELRDEPEKTACWYCVAFIQLHWLHNLHARCYSFRCEHVLERPALHIVRSGLCGRQGQATDCQTTCKHCFKDWPC